MTPTDPALGLHTDLYEIRMAETYVRRGMLEPATFSLFVRPSSSRPWLVVAGIDRALEVLSDYRFDAAQLDYLAEQGTPDHLLDHLRDLRFDGEVWAVPDGTVVLGDEPLLELTAPLPTAQLVETAVINAVQLDTLVATKAARCVIAAEGRPVVDYGFRRAHGLDAGIRAARAAYLGGVEATSNVEAGHRFGIPITGTMAHSFVQAFDRETDAFREFARDHPDDTTLLVDTYDVDRGIGNAVTVIRELAADGIRVGAIRIDSQPLDALASRARVRLDEAGLTDVRILASGGLDEWSVAELVGTGAPVDGFGIGSALVVSSDRPTLDIAYKLVEYAGRGRAKYSPGKRFLPGPQQVWRRDGPESDVLDRRDSSGEGRPLLRPVWSEGGATYTFDLESARRRVREQLEELPRAWRALDGAAEPPVPAVSPALDAFAREVEARELGD